MDPISPTNSQPYPPHYLESACYYHRMGASLIARTSTWTYPTWVPEQPDRIAYFPIGDHEILYLWTDELIRSLRRALTGLNWQRFYPIRHGSESPFQPIGPQKTLVMIVDVEEDAEWEVAIEIAMLCRQILREARIRDIEVEIRGISRRLFAMDVEIDRTIAQSLNSQGPENISYLLKPFSYEGMSPFLSDIGYQVAPESETGDVFGTMGLHVKLAVQSGAYGLTCRHVAHKPSKEGSEKDGYWLPNSKGYNSTTEDEGRKHRMVQLCPSELERYKEIMRNELSHAESKKARLDGAQSRQVDGPSRISERDKKHLRDLPRDLPYAREVHRLVSAESHDTPDGRAIGYIAHMPPLEVSTRGYLRDWALIRLDEAKFAQTPTNRVYIHRERQGEMERGSDLADIEEYLSRRKDKNGMANLQGTVPPSEQYPRKSIRVAKVGASSGWTFGITNELPAVVRTPDDVEAIAWEWVVLSPHRWMTHTRSFSQPGDSGAAVFDFRGRVLGFIGSGFDPASTGGSNGETEARREDDMAFRESRRWFVDLGFVTPVEAVFEDIRRVTGCEVEIA